jgi:hypothetical protein
MMQRLSVGPGRVPVPISLGAELVVSVLGDVADPGQRLVTGLLYDLQIPDLKFTTHDVDLLTDENK